MASPIFEQVEIINSSYIGRFAPSPTGDLHFGSLVAAVASYLQAKCNGGKWLVRIEDIDPPRVVAGSAMRILEDLEKLGMVSDEPVLFQSTHLLKFDSVCRQLIESEMAFKCSCSRKSLPSGGIYPGTCRETPADLTLPLSIRIKTHNEPIEFDDRVQGRISQNLSQDCGDFVIWRADGLPAYQLAVVLDDALQGITEVVRGSDLLDSTGRQIHLQQTLGLPTPDYLHLPIATLKGEKLGKRIGSDPVSQKNPARAVKAALDFLGQASPEGLSQDQLWEWAFENWNVGSILAKESIPMEVVSGNHP